MSRENPARTLEQTWAGMSWEVERGSFALLGFAEAPVAADLEALGAGPGQVVREGGETTLLLPCSALAEALARHPGASVECDLAWVRFRSPMDWGVVGFLARVTGELAAAGIPLGAVCGFSRDHLFVARGHLPRARDVLARLFGPEAD